MKPKDLKYPFSWEERHSHYEDQLLVVPGYYTSHKGHVFDKWDDWPNIGVEYCSGNGDWVVLQAQKNPEMLWFAVELRFDRVRKIWSKAKNSALKNLIVVWGEALTFTECYVPDNQIEVAHIHFPDPWPKERHEKHRLIKPPFIQQLARALKREKSIHLVSDDRSYVQESANYFTQSGSFKARAEKLEVESYGNSWFEKLWREKGRSIYHLEYAKWN